MSGFSNKTKKPVPCRRPGLAVIRAQSGARLKEFGGDGKREKARPKPSETDEAAGKTGGL